MDLVASKERRYFDVRRLVVDVVDSNSIAQPTLTLFITVGNSNYNNSNNTRCWCKKPVKRSHG